MFGLLRRITRALLAFAKRLFLNKPHNAYEGILFEAITATQAEMKRGMA